MHHDKDTTRQGLRGLAGRAFHQLGLHTTPQEVLRARYGDDRSEYIDIGDTSVHFKIEGNPSGPTLVLTHGVLASLHTWDGWVDALAEDYRIVRFDIPGFGLSDANAHGGYDPDYCLRLLHGFFDALGLDDFHLVGNSLGGFMAWQYAALHPERVRKLILIDPIGYGQKLPAVMRTVTWPGLRTLGRRLAPKMVVRANLREVYATPERIHPTIFERYYDLLSHPGGRDAMVDVFLTLRYFNGHPEVTSKMRLIQSPTLIMWGEHDVWVPISHLDHWRRDVPHAETIVYPDAGHVPMEEIPERTAADARRFLSNTGGA